MNLLFSLTAAALVLSRSLAVENGTATPPPPEAPPPFAAWEGFNTTAGCEDRCRGAEEAANDHDHAPCDADAFGDCQCVFGDRYCLSECDSGTWMTMCAGGGLPPKEEVPPVPPPPVTPPGFVTTPGCEDRCDGMEGAKECDGDTFEGCKCVFADQYCFSECLGGEWMMACAGGGGGGDVPPPPSLPKEEEVPPASPEVPPVSPPGFVTTPGCEDRCDGVEEGAKKCDGATFEGCKCVFADQYCFSECDGGEWMMACAEGGGGGDLPPPKPKPDPKPPTNVTDTPPKPEDPAGEPPTNAADTASPTAGPTGTASPQAPAPSAPTIPPSRSADVGDGEDGSSAPALRSLGIAAGMTLLAIALCGR